MLGEGLGETFGMAWDDSTYMKISSLSMAAWQIAGKTLGWSTT
jgi:hypothetical protein